MKRLVAEMFIELMHSHLCFLKVESSLGPPTEIFLDLFYIEITGFTDLQWHLLNKFWPHHSFEKKYRSWISKFSLSLMTSSWRDQREKCWWGAAKAKSSLCFLLFIQESFFFTSTVFSETLPHLQGTFTIYRPCSHYGLCGSQASDWWPWNSFFSKKHIHLCLPYEYPTPCKTSYLQMVSYSYALAKTGVRFPIYTDTGSNYKKI